MIFGVEELNYGADYIHGKNKCKRFFKRINIKEKRKSDQLVIVNEKTKLCKNVILK